MLDFHEAKMSLILIYDDYKKIYFCISQPCIHVFCIDHILLQL